MTNRIPTDMIEDRSSGQKLNEQLADKATKTRLKDISVNVKDYGAVGDWNGTTGTNNLTAFNNAVAALPSTGGEILIPDGDYWISDSWNIDKDNIAVKIMPNATVRTTAPTSGGQTIGFIGYLGSGTAITPQRKNARIYGGGTVRNTSSGTNENAIGVSRYSGFVCEGIQIPEANRKAITCQYGVDNIIIRNNNIGSTSNNAIAIENDCKNIFVEKNKIDSATGNGIHVTVNCVDVKIEDNTIKQSTVDGIFVGGSSSNIKIKNNKVTNSAKGIELLTVSDVVASDNKTDLTSTYSFVGKSVSGTLNLNNNTFANNQNNESIRFESCTTKPVLFQNTVSGTTHTYAMNVLTMGGYEPLMTGNKLSTGTTGLFNGWKPKFVRDIVDGTEYVVENGKRIMFGTVAPTTGTYAVGDRVINSAPAVGQPKAWTCTVAGTPGTWVSEGNL